MNNYLVEMTNIVKKFYGITVLNDVDFRLHKGTVHALMGENGAGKSTLVKVLAGIHKKDAGTIKIDGKAVEIDSPALARELGIAMIHQELSPIGEMTIAENIFLGREPNRFGFVDFKTLFKKTEELLAQLKIPLNPKTKMKNLRVADQQMVEIAKAISQNARIVIMDEPTSSITDKEVESLFKVIEDMKAHGTGVIYISHKTDEIMHIADEITVLRDGEFVNTWDAKQVEMKTVIHSMVGRELTEQFPKKKVPIGKTILKVENLSLSNQYENISFELHEGEILGLVGLMGAGRTELMHSLFGITKPEQGTVTYLDKAVSFKHPRDAIKHGIVYVTEDRKGDGLVLPMSVQHNVTLSSLRKLEKLGLIQNRQEVDSVIGQVSGLRIKTNNMKQAVMSLSGGNQQKVVLAKWMITKPQVMIFDEPTRGIDVGAKAEIYKIMCEFVSKGNAIIMVSSEMPEAIGMSDRMIIMSNHRFSGELSRNEFSEETIAQLQFRFL